MTRRDYCFICSKFVGDDGPYCEKCGNDFCVDCPRVKDPLSRLSLLIAKIRTYSNINISTLDIKQCAQDLQSNEVNIYIQDTYPICEEDPYWVYDDVVEEFNECRKKIINLYNENDEKTNEKATIFIELINELYTILHEPLPFTCKNCYYNSNINK